MPERFSSELLTMGRHMNLSTFTFKAWAAKIHKKNQVHLEEPPELSNN